MRFYVINFWQIEFFFFTLSTDFLKTNNLKNNIYV